MTLSDLGAMGSFLAAIAVFITLIYLSRQVKQGNAIAKLQVRQTMTQHDMESLDIQRLDKGMIDAIRGKSVVDDDYVRLHYFLVRCMRQREWEWYQYTDGVIDEATFKTYHEVIAIHLGTASSREWWKTVGRLGIDPAFVAVVDALLAKRDLVNYFDAVMAYAASRKQEAT